MKTTIACVDVGEGDCTVVVDHATSAAVVIDCRLGHDDAALRELRSLGVRTISAVVASHTHSDHLLGLPTIVESTERHGLLPKATPFHVNIDTLRGSTDLVRALRYLVEKAQDGVVTLLPATHGETGSAGNTTWTIVGPQHVTVVKGAVGNRNVASAIVLITVTGWGEAMLISGDATLAAWRAADAIRPLPQHAYVRWPHHGGNIGGVSAHSDLYRLLDPAVVIVSVGDSGTHPNAQFRAAASNHPSTTLCTGAGRGCPSSSVHCRGTIRVMVTDGIANVATDHGRPGPGCC